VYLVEGDSPMGYRLPLGSLPEVLPEEEDNDFPQDPFDRRNALGQRKPSRAAQAAKKGKSVRLAAPGNREVVKTALTVQARGGSLFVFLPVTPFLEGYVANAGRIALPLIYIAVVGALFRTRFSEWRYFHLIIYLALLLGLLHGTLFSRYFFGSLFLNVLFLGLGAALVAAFVAKRWQRRRGR
jgi:hypothetical protein